MSQPCASAFWPAVFEPHRFGIGMVTVRKSDGESEDEKERMFIFGTPLLAVLSRVNTSRQTYISYFYFCTYLCTYQKPEKERSLRLLYSSSVQFIHYLLSHTYLICIVLSSDTIIKRWHPHDECCTCQDYESIVREWYGDW